MPAPNASRTDAVDALRGLAMVWMAGFHFAFDLDHFRYVDQDFLGDPLWTGQRTAILGLFLLCAGAGQSIAHHQGQSTRRFLQRWLQIAGCAVLVSVGSWWMFPRTFIHFGVLHGMAVMLLVARATAGAGAWLWLAGALALVLHHALPQWLVGAGFSEALHSRWLNWLGLIVHKPATEDYVPVLPWMAVMWWGMALADWARRRQPWWWQWQARSGFARGLVRLGQWSLSFYMVHQPLLIGALLAWGFLQAR
jgi:uncharacterized membrane protein